MNLSTALPLVFIHSSDEALGAYDMHYQPTQVLVSVLLAVFAASCALEMANHKTHRPRWIALGALMLGLGTWAMHFIGMTALRIDCGIQYEPWLTALSVLPGVAAAAVALHFAARDRAGLATLLLAGTVMGAGVGLMHYLGMAAMRLDGALRYDSRLFLLSIVAAVLLAIGALWLRQRLLGTRLGRHPFLGSLAGGSVLGLAISAMHYTAMAGAYFLPGAGAGTEAAGFTDPTALATVVGLLTLLLLLGGLAFLVASARIAMARQRAEAMQAMLRKVTAVLDNMGDGLLVTDAQGRVTQVNPALLALYRLDEEEGGGQALAGLPVRAVFGDEVGDFVAKALDEQRATPSLTAEVAVLDSRVARVVATVLGKDSAERQAGSQGLVITFRDITHEVEVSRMKTDFIANVSHELRTPLTSVLGFAKVIRKQFQRSVLPALDPQDSKAMAVVEKIQSQLDIIVSEGERLTNLINDVLDLTKIEAGKIEWRDEPVDMGALLQRAVDATAAIYQPRELPLKLNVQRPLPLLRGDPDRLLQVIINLLSNAAKFTEQGEVRCWARLEGGRLTVAVADQGCGISEFDQQQLFERFRQVGNTLTDKPRGTGLGLAICKQVIEHHRGEIWVESQVGQGSTFCFALPLPEQAVVEDALVATDTAPAVALAALGGQPRTILVVDDETNIRALLRLELEAAGYRVREAADGVQAIQQVKQSPPDLILLDVMMPGMSGFEVAAVLRSTPEANKIPIVILSIVDDRARGRAVGADSYLSKPINMEVLLPEIDGLLRRRESTKRMLLVDDRDAPVVAVTQMLRAKGYQVEVLDPEMQRGDRAAALPEMMVVFSPAEDPLHVASSMQAAREGERVYLVVTGAGPARPAP